MRSNSKSTALAASFPTIQAILLATIAAGPATAQESTILEEVVVTAQKREQNIQEIGISVTAFSQEQMDALGYNDAIDIASQTPGLSVARPGAGAINIFTIRGVTQNDYGANQEAPVTVYVDEAYISHNVAGNFSLYDLERIEVLRGPQGTLFGRNATGGLVQYVTARPSQEFDAFVEGQIGSEGRHRVEAAVGGGVSETVSARLSGVWNENNGLMENEIGKDGQAADDWSVRGQMLFEPQENLSILLKGQYSEDDSDRGNYHHRVVSAGEYLPPPATDFFGYRDADDNEWTGAWDFDGVKKSEIAQATVRVEWRGESIRLTYIGDYQDIDDVYSEDSDVSPAGIFDYEQSTDVQQWSQEVRLNWDGERARAVAGAYILDIDGNYGHDSLVFGQPDFDWANAFFGVPEPGGYRLVSDFEQETFTWALFAQVEFDLTETVTLVGGIRWTQDDKEYTYKQGWTNVEGLFVFFENAVAGDVPYFDYRDSFNEGDWSGKIQINYSPTDDLLWFVSVNRGIKSGGFNAPTDASGLLGVNAFGQFIPFDQNNDVMDYGGEVLTSYEGGLKSTWYDNRLRFNGSVFYYDYSDYQISNFVGLTQTIFNSEGELWGGELEIAASPVDGLDLLAGVSYLNTEVDLPAGIRPDGRLKSDTVLSPEWAINALVRYSWSAFGHGLLALQGDVLWKDDHIFNLANTGVVKEDGYAVANLSLNYSSPTEAFYAGVFVKNLFNEEYQEYGFDLSTGFGSCECVPGLERWFGVKAGFRWK